MKVEIKEAYHNIEDIKTLFEEYADSIGIDLAYQNYEQELKTLPGKYVWPYGRLYIAYADGIAAGCIALRKFDEQRCEMKRLYVRNQFRGLSIGQILAKRVISDARTIGYAYMLLDTLSTMASARALYKKLGFAEIAPYYESPIEDTHYLCLAL